ncbi:hypothetical protein LIER_31995 [Lithospermum erythrorhizon]|uniref:Uncharacterized protein n=1 Tax=Lithospermum erythrorhizon TaxID=34254 RepID=A0AAV3RWG3_LITER
MRYPYSLSSGITVTEKTVSKREEPTASLLLRNCMLKADISSKHEIDIAVFNSSLEDLEEQSRDMRAQLESSRQLSADLEKQLFMRPPPEVVIEKFKEGQNYKDLLIDDIVSIMKTFSLKVYEEFHGVHSMFPEFVREHFRKEYVVDLTDGEEESDDNSNDTLSSCLLLQFIRSGAYDSPYFVRSLLFGVELGLRLGFAGFKEPKHKISFFELPNFDHSIVKSCHQLFIPLHSVQGFVPELISEVEIFSHLLPILLLVETELSYIG